MLCAANAARAHGQAQPHTAHSPRSLTWSAIARAAAVRNSSTSGGLVFDVTVVSDPPTCSISLSRVVSDIGSGAGWIADVTLGPYPVHNRSGRRETTPECESDMWRKWRTDPPDLYKRYWSCLSRPGEVLIWR